MDGEDQTTEQQPEAPEPRRLYRTPDDRVIAGVCGGIARYFKIDTAIVRIVAVALAVFGGAGVLLYLAALLLMASSPDGQPLVGGEGRSRALAAVGVGLLLLIGWPLILGGGLAVAAVFVPLAVLALTGLVTWWLVSGEGPSGETRDVLRRSALGLGVLLVCFLLFLGGAWAAAAGGGTVAAVLVIAAGVAVVAGAFVRRGRWLVLPALTLALGVGFVSAAGIDLDGGIGDRNYSPASAAELHDKYQLGMGEIVVDLTGTDLPAGDTPLAVDLGVGNAELYVPEDVCVATRAKMGAGAVQVFDHENAGVDLDWEDRPSAPSDGKRLVLDAEVGVGALQVHHVRGPDFRRGRPFGPDRQDVGDETNSGCAAAS